jgi:CYTH domain-containing protein
MGLEIERKFLVKNNSWKSEAQEGVLIRQGEVRKLNKCAFYLVSFWFGTRWSILR